VSLKTTYNPSRNGAYLIARPDYDVVSAAGAAWRASCFHLRASQHIYELGSIGRDSPAVDLRKAFGAEIVREFWCTAAGAKGDV